jgi:hypothetical protein
MAYENRYNEIAIKARTLLGSKGWHFEQGLKFPSLMDTEASLATAHTVVRVLSKVNMLYPSEAEEVRELKAKLEQLDEFDGLLINYVCGVAFEYLRHRFASARTAGMVMNMHGYLDRALDGSEEAVALLLKEGKKLQAYYATLDFYVFQSKPMRFTEEWDRDGGPSFEMFKRLTAEWDEAADAIWVYGALNGASWA